MKEAIGNWVRWIYLHCFIADLKLSPLSRVCYISHSPSSAINYKCFLDPHASKGRPFVCTVILRIQGYSVLSLCNCLCRAFIANWKAHKKRKHVQEEDLSESSTCHVSVCLMRTCRRLTINYPFPEYSDKMLTKQIKEQRFFFNLTVPEGYSPSWGRSDSKNRRKLVTWYPQSGSRE